MSWEGSQRQDEGVEMRGPAERVAREVPNNGLAATVVEDADAPRDGVCWFIRYCIKITNAIRFSKTLVYFLNPANAVLQSYGNKPKYKTWNKC